MAQPRVPAVNEHGMTVLFEAENSTVDIIYVHGFTGHPEHTWTSGDPPEKGLPFRKRPAPSSNDVQPPPSKVSRIFSSNPPRPTGLNEHGPETAPKTEQAHGVYWPRDLVPATLPHSRVLTYGYDTNIRSRLGNRPVSKKSVGDHGWDLLCALADHRRDAPSRPLIFVAHSLGGLISKVALIRSSEHDQHHTQPHLHDIAQSTVGALFFGTPHRGADPLNIAHHMLKALLGLAWHHNGGVVQTLLQGGDYLKSIQDRFVALLKHNRWTVFSFQEEYPFPGLFGKQVVGDESSCIGDPELERKRHIGRNHRDMVRFSGHCDPEYEKVASALRSICDHLQIPSEHPLQDNESQGNGPLLAELPDIDSPVTAEVLARRQELLELLYFDEIDARLLSLKTAYNKTCVWFLEKEEYRQWLDLQNLERHHGFLWIKGKPGSGKSILMKFLEARTRQSAAKDPNRLFASYFFYAAGAHLERSTLGLYRSLLWQLFQKAPGLQQALDGFNFNACRVMKRSGWQTEALKETIERAIDCLGDRDLSVFIDALDECRDDDVADMVSFFEDLGERAAEKVLEDQDEHSEDITRYISSKLNLPKSKRAQDIRNEVLEKSGGIFLWVALVIPILNKASADGRVDQLQRCLDTIPRGLDGLFDKLLARDDEDMDELRLCIQLVLFAIRPVTLTEYFFALRRAGDKDLHDSWAAEEVDRDIMGRFALSSSKGLAEVTKTRRKDKDPTVQFIHESVRDFLFSQNGRRRLWPSFNQDEFTGFSHDALKLRCLGEIKAYQNRKLWRVAVLKGCGEVTDSQASTKSVENHMWPFLRYATDNLLFHANRAQQYGVSQDGFLFQFSEHQQDWVELYNVFERFKSRRYNDTVDIIYILAEHGLDSLLQIHPRLSSHLNIRGGGRYHVPLAAAILLKHKSTTRILVASLSPDPDFATGIEDRVIALPRGRNSSFTSLEDVYKLLLKFDHIPLIEHFIYIFSWKVCRQTLEGHISLVWSVAFSPDGQSFASASLDCTIRLWDTATGACRQTLEGHSKPSRAVAFSPDGQTLASASDDCTIRLWDTTTGGYRQTLEGHSDCVMAVAFSPNGQTLASASCDNTVRLWDTAMGAYRQTLEGHSNTVKAVAFSPDGQTVVSASYDTTVRLWDPATGVSRQTLEGHRMDVNAIAFSPDGQTLASASYDCTIRLWDTATGAYRQTLEGHRGSVNAVAFSPDGQTLASASNDNRVRLCDTATGAYGQTLEGHSSCVTAVAFSPDGQTLVSASYDNTVRLWDPATGVSGQTLEGHSGDVKAIAFSPDGQTLASASDDRTVRLWVPLYETGPQQNHRTGLAPA